MSLLMDGIGQKYDIQQYVMDGLPQKISQKPLIQELLLLMALLGQSGI